MTGVPATVDMHFRNGNVVAARCTFVAGDFTATILGRCAEVMAEGGRLLIVERLLPDDRSASLAFAWDIHMLCNVGGRWTCTC